MMLLLSGAKESEVDDVIDDMFSFSYVGEGADTLSDGFFNMFA